MRYEGRRGRKMNIKVGGGIWGKGCYMRVNITVYKRWGIGGI